MWRAFVTSNSTISADVVPSFSLKVLIMGSSWKGVRSMEKTRRKNDKDVNKNNEWTNVLE